MELEDPPTLGRLLRTVEVDAVDEADEPDPERDAARDGSEDVAKERDALRRIQLGRVTTSFRPRTVIVAWPAARRLRTQWTSPHGDQTQRRPAASMIATASCAAGRSCGRGW